MKKHISLTLLAIACCISMNAFAASIPEKLNFPAIANNVCQQRPYFWMNPTAGASLMRHEIINMLDSGAYLGLNKSRFHLGVLRGNDKVNIHDTAAVRTLERYFTDAVITYCHDLIRLPAINGWMWYDEIQDNYEQKIKDQLLVEMLSVNNISDLRELVLSVQPANEEYQALIRELSVQMQENQHYNTKKLTVSLAYYRWAHFFHFKKLIVVNIASANLRYYEENEQKLEMKVVVGKPSTKTPRFTAYCNQVILYPYWHVPRSIAVNEILPRCKKNPGVVNAMNLQVLNSHGTVVNPRSINWNAYGRSNFPYTFRQSTGCDNALGVIKFNITDPFNVYLHDTNFKLAFNSKKRYLSHGCIRVEKPIELANHILTDSLNSTFLKACVRQQKPVPMSIQKVPVFVTYMPAEVDSAGTVIYHDDIYQLL